MFSLLSCHLTTYIPRNDVSFHSFLSLLLLFTSVRASVHCRVREPPTVLKYVGQPFLVSFRLCVKKRRKIRLWKNSSLGENQYDEVKQNLFFLVFSILPSSLVYYEKCERWWSLYIIFFSHSHHPDYRIAHWEMRCTVRSGFFAPQNYYTSMIPQGGGACNILQSKIVAHRKHIELRGQEDGIHIYSC